MKKILITILSFFLCSTSSVRADAGGAIVGGVLGGAAGVGLGCALASHDRHQCKQNHPESRKRKHVEVVQVDDEDEEEVEVVYVRQPRRVVRRVCYEEPVVYAPAPVVYHVGSSFCPPVYTHVEYHHPMHVHAGPVCNDCSFSPAPLFLGAFGAGIGAMIGGLCTDD